MGASVMLKCMSGMFYFLGMMRRLPMGMDVPVRRLAFWMLEICALYFLLRAKRVSPFLTV